MSVETIRKSVNGGIACLKENPGDALSTSPPITAAMEAGLRCCASGDSGQSVVTDRPQTVEGDGSAPSPGRLSRAALATCDATRIALRAAELAIELDTLKVTTNSADDDRGLFWSGLLGSRWFAEPADQGDNRRGGNQRKGAMGNRRLCCDPFTCR